MRRSIASACPAAASAPARSPCANPCANASRSTAAARTSGCTATAVEDTAGGNAAAGSAGNAEARPVDCQVNGRTTAWAAARRALADILVGSFPTSDEQALFLKRPGDGDDSLLRLFHLAHADGAHHFHFLAHHFGRAFGHVAEDP